MKVNTLTAIVMLTAILTHCNKIDDPNSKRVIDIDENKSASIIFKLRKKIPILGIFSPALAVSKIDNNIFVYGKSLKRDKTSFVINVYNHDLDYILQKKFYYGQGPGDVGLTNVITAAGNNIYISENSNLRVSKYDRYFNFIRTDRYNQEYVTYPFEIFKDGRLFVGCKLDNEQKKFDSYVFSIISYPEMKAKKLFRTEPYDPYERNAKSRRFLLGENTEFSYFFHNNSIYLLLNKKYRILKFDLEGKKVADLSVRFYPIKTKKELEEQHLKEQGYINKRSWFGFSSTVTPTSWMIPLKNGFIIPRRSDYSTYCEGFTKGDYFSYNLEYIGKTTFPCFLNIYKITGGMPVNSYKFEAPYLYTVKEVDEEYILEKWEVLE